MHLPELPFVATAEDEVELSVVDLGETILALSEAAPPGPGPR